MFVTGPKELTGSPPKRPRWLVEHNKPAEALHTLTFYREGSFSSTEIEAEFDSIRRAVASFHTQAHLPWTALVTDQALWARTWRAALLQFMAQMCGATAMKYYLPTLFAALGLGRRLALLAGGVESTLKIGCTLVEMAIIDRVGRRLTMVGGAVVMAVAMMVCQIYLTHPFHHRGPMFIWHSYHSEN